MLLDFQTIDDVKLKTELTEIQAVIDSSAFLQGLFVESQIPENTEGFRIFSDPINLDMRIQTPGYYYDDPEKWSFRDLSNILGEEESRIMYEGVFPSYNEVLEVKELYWELIKGVADKTETPVNNQILKLMKRYSDYSVSLQNKFNLTENNVNYIFKLVVPNVVQEHILLLVKAAVFGGLEHSPICQRVLDCYRLGGMPGGWVGPLPENGGKAKDCIELYHLGQ
ncbi:hypothetical protein HR060_16375 [Catenovulum sp. SM1970]|uniref:hypothetical protein n=1 Tax=Marinifaba aquimaris TaxID=2741323 RepID=UPI0015737BE8|nr:hypothetical protein [Marinifaba aquimaris]NTS78426.1 hypothetical protein [Marinifaba aquimaris]